MRWIHGVTLALAFVAAEAGAQESEAAAEEGAAVDDSEALVAPPETPPKIAVVVAGDPDEGMQSAASELEQECRNAGLRVPTDPALREALRGEPALGDDGLSALRAIRRGLGVNPRQDLASYKRLGTIAGADALVVLHRQGNVKLEVFDVSAGQFYEGVLELETTSPEARVKYIERRARMAQARWSDTGAGAALAATNGDEVTASADVATEDESQRKRRIKKIWPFLVVGSLLIGGVTFLIVDGRRTNEPGPPLLRFTPGDE